MVSVIFNKKTIAPIPNGAEFYQLAKTFRNLKKNIIFISRENSRSKQIYDMAKTYIGGNVLHMPAWDTQPYDLLSPSEDILHKRIATLGSLIEDQSKKIIITSFEVLNQKLIPKEFLTNHIIEIYTGQKISQDDIITALIANGYHRSSSANDPGKFSVRGSILDIFANGYKVGHRIDFFGNKIEFIKSFDPTTQITINKEQSFKILPPSEIILSTNTKLNFKNKIISKFGTKALKSVILEKFENGIKPIGIEQWYNLFYDRLDTIYDYVPDAIFIFDFMAWHNFEFHNTNILEKYNARDNLQLNENSVDIPSPPEELYLGYDKIVNFINNKSIFFNDNIAAESDKSQIRTLPNLEHESQIAKTTIFQLLTNYFKNDKPLIISCVSEGSKERIKKIFQDYNILLQEIDFNSQTEKFGSGVCIGPYEKGFETNEFILVTEQDIFGERIKAIKSNKSKLLKNLIEQINNFVIGELVVHKEHGIGRFEGLETLEMSGLKHDCIKIIYANDDKLFVPVEYIDLITKYGLEGDIKLDKLGGASWQERKARTKNKIKLSAEYLLKIAAERTIKKATIIEPQLGIFEEFCASFPYVETEDQLNAINDVKNDLARGQPMDRLICGDVGFGKTEVALRAAFIAVKSSNLEKYQVAIFCPTTLLCRQHYKLFSERLKKFDIKVKQLSRLVNHAEAKRTIDEINNGEVDIIIGTHTLLNQKIKFKNLALLIIDEEQHFGVIQKEKLKEFRTNIHILTLSATPIPRTLQMSLIGIKDLSLIATPPVNRLVTKTAVLLYDPIIIKEALLREYYRGGQSFYVCPRITDIDDIEQLLKEIVPNLKTVIAHGQMPPAKLDQIMNDFYDGKFDILLSTSIIESGLDIPKANTLIVHNADKFGLGQLYQIRGRVGRSNIPAYAYFTLPNNRKLKPDTLSRLEILQNIDHLGAGFSVAANDMDSRGFGNLVGDEQSGHIKEIGVELYQDLLRDAVNKLRNHVNDTDLTEDILPQINLGISALIPENYVNDLDLRLNLYKRMASLKDNQQIELFAAELFDRFGKTPQELENLLSIIKLKNLCTEAHIAKIDVGPRAILIKINESKIRNPEKLLKFIMSNPHNIKLRSNNEIIFTLSSIDQNNKIKAITDLIQKLVDLN